MICHCRLYYFNKNDYSSGPYSGDFHIYFAVCFIYKPWENARFLLMFVNVYCLYQFFQHGVIGGHDSPHKF